MREADRADLAVRRATAADVSTIGQLLHDVPGSMTIPRPVLRCWLGESGRLLG